MKPTKKVKPSRARYEASHRVVSARLDRELHEKLKAHLATNGESFAAFVKAALEADQAKMAARVEELAGRRSGLQKQLRELALAVADKGRQLKASVEEERTRLLRQMEADVEGERQRRFNALEQAFRQEKVSCEWQLSLLDKDVVRLSKEVADKEEHRARLDMELANRERLMRQLTEQALAELRRQGV
ncbi:MAG: hypothetical protein Q8O76_07560, partial [Chloroflexota bacterium]|nr:hypothetical protein [Chloroflexota bacterium]